MQLAQQSNVAGCIHAKAMTYFFVCVKENKKSLPCTNRMKRPYLERAHEMSGK